MDNKLPGINTELVQRLFARGEAFDSEGFITFFTDTPVYQFANFNVCLDKASIKKSSEEVFTKISAVYHEIKMIWEVNNVVFVEMDVIYWRKDNSMVTLPCTDIFRFEGEKISEMRIFIDVNPLFDPSIPITKTISVFTENQERKLIPPGTMKRFYSEHPEGRERVSTGFAPKWSIDGPKWPIATFSGDLLSKAKKMVEALTVEDWEAFYPFFTEDLFYKVGANKPLHGSKAAAGFLSNFYQIIKPTKHDIRGTWQIENTVIIEMDANYKRVSDGKKITVPCTDIYRFQEDLIKEWRVYPDMSPVEAT
jgi:limonene-1,2-epoxide hydrolase